jgi:histidinol-phosphatase
MTDDLALAHELADIADVITLSHFRTTGLRVETKPDMSPVSAADKAAEAAMRRRIGEARPADGVLGEEEGEDGSAAAGRRWILDPIDGTKNYVSGVPVWATLVALQEGEEFTVGVASAPALARRWWASRGAGARMSDGLGPAPRGLGVSAVSELSEAHLCFAGIEEWEEIGRLDALLKLARSCWRTRGFGDFWQYMLLAEGAVDLCVESEANHWDLAAPKLIVEEAGGRLTDLRGEDTAAGGDCLASNGVLHDEALRELRAE